MSQVRQLEIIHHELRLIRTHKHPPSHTHTHTAGPSGLSRPLDPSGPLWNLWAFTVALPHTLPWSQKVIWQSRVLAEVAPHEENLDVSHDTQHLLIGSLNLC